ncbi:MAG: alpha/beta hydrolase [Gammaproteobacteria bacterium]|nr:alpha/beta hydrolase [Gammaproteobacteria bacterium]
MRDIAIAIYLVLFTQPAWAELIRATLPNGLNVTAEYNAAKDGNPTVLIVHPLLQTRDFSVIVNLSEALISDGYGVLRPTLSLGIDSRRQSLACEAIHNYSMQDKIDEIAFWKDWLDGKSAGPVIGFGHSSGGTLVAMYEDQQQTSAFKSLILLAPVHYGFPGGTGIDPRQMEQAFIDEKEKQPDRLEQYRLSYCKKFTTPRSHYLEFVRWDEAAVTNLLKGIKVHTDVVYGTADPTLNSSWKLLLEQSNIPISYVSGGNHFFSGFAELDMHDVVLDLIDDQI